MDKQYYPKGSMCMVCVNTYADCSKLDFESMPVISTKYPDRIIVKCKMFTKDKLTPNDKG